MELITQDMIEQWKKQYGAVYKISLSDSDYYYRYLTRKEYREFVKLNQETVVQTGSPVDQLYEEKIVKACLLYPTNIDIEKCPAGVVSMLSDEIMKVSGFVTALSEKL